MSVRIGTVVRAFDTSGRMLRREIVTGISDQGFTRQVITEDEETELLRVPEERRISLLAAWRGSIQLGVGPKRPSSLS